MSLLELLMGDWRMMSWIGFFCKIFAVTCPLIGFLHVTFIVFKDEFLSRHIILTLILSALFSFTCCLLTLSKICMLRRKPHAVKANIDQLWDTDLNFKNETEELPYNKLSLHYKDVGKTLINFFFKNPFEFCKFRPAYGTLLVTGIASLFAFAAAFRLANERKTTDDLYCVAVELVSPMIMLIFVIYFIANSGYYVARKDYDVYTPFEEFVQVPMKKIVGKSVAIFVTSGGTYWLLAVFLVFITALCIISSNYLFHASEMADALKCLLPPIFPEPLKLLRTVLVITCVVLVNAMVGMSVSAFTDAKKSILGVIERNWHQNLRAIAFLLEDTEAETLKDLKTALVRKRNLPLTELEEKAFNYISWPIWQTKPPFMLRKFERESPDPETLDEVDDKDGSENIQQPHATVKPEHKISTNVEQHSPPVVHEVSAESSTSQKCETSRLDEPSTSSASF